MEQGHGWLWPEGQAERSRVHIWLPILQFSIHALQQGGGLVVLQIVLNHSSHHPWRLAMLAGAKRRWCVTSGGPPVPHASLQQATEPTVSFLTGLLFKKRVK